MKKYVILQMDLYSMSLSELQKYSSDLSQQIEELEREIAGGSKKNPEIIDPGFKELYIKLNKDNIFMKIAEIEKYIVLSNETKDRIGRMQMKQ